MSDTQMPHLKDLSWLVRYANHSHVDFDPAEPIQSLRMQFSKAAWRVLCRSKRDDFIPILQNRQLTFRDLHAYCQALAEFGWLKAPERVLLNFVITESYRYYNCEPSVPTAKEKFVFMRLAKQAEVLSTKELSLVRNWHTHQHMELKPQMKWSRLVARAKLWRLRERVRLERPNDQTWHFYSRALPWRGYDIVPIDTPLALFDEAVAMGTCLYTLRHLCCRNSQTSRFFSLRKQGNRVATFELTLGYPQPTFKGWDLRYGKWTLQDARLSFNRLATKEVTDCVVAFAGMYNIWSKRPARQPGYDDSWFAVKPVDPAQRDHNKTSLSQKSSVSHGHVQQLTARYERQMGMLPIWLHQLDLERIAPLLACCLRVGMPLPIGNLLEADEGERRAQAGRSIRRPSGEP
jgi:hypothetical protein